MPRLKGFAGRLAYLRWIRAVGRIKPETDRELAQALGVGEKWLAKWKLSEKPPEGRSEAIAIQRALEADQIYVSWLYDDIGDPPRQDLWAVWTASQGVTAKAAQPAERSQAAKALGDAAAAAAGKARVAKLEPKDVPAPRPQAKPAEDRGKGKRAS